MMKLKRDVMRVVENEGGGAIKTNFTLKNKFGNF